MFVTIAPEAVGQSLPVPLGTIAGAAARSTVITPFLLNLALTVAAGLHRQRLLRWAYPPTG